MIVLDSHPVELIKIRDLVAQIIDDMRLEKSRGLERDKMLTEMKIFCKGLLKELQDLEIKVSQIETFNDDFHEFVKNKFDQFEYLRDRNEILEYSESLFSMDGDANCNY